MVPSQIGATTIDEGGGRLRNGDALPSSTGA